MAIKDYSADKRQEYNQAIAAKERELEELREQKKADLEELDAFGTGMGEGLAELVKLNEDLVSKGSLVAGAKVDEQREMARSIKQLVEQHREELTESFAKSRQRTEDEIEALQRKRDSLPWDAPKTDKDTKEK